MFSAALVKKIFSTLFSKYPDAATLWESCDDFDQKESLRVKLAILKLCDGEVDKLLHYIEVARFDYRDVLAWAEYPEQMGSGKTRYNSPLDEYEAMLERDRHQYEAWIAGFREIA